MDLKIRGKAAFVMGGSRGIGRAIATELAAAGCKVVIAARNPTAIQMVVDELRRSGAEAIGISADLSQFTEIDRAIAEATAAFGAPEIAIFNPPSPVTGTVMGLTEDAFATGYHDVVLCFMHMVKQLAEPMRAAGWGRIVTLGSMATKQPARSNGGFGYAVANVTRLAAVAMSKTLAAELGRSGITINTIAVGSINSQLGVDFLANRAAESGVTPEEFQAQMFNHSILGRMGRVEEVANLAAYLCSERASYTTGENILCDGGLANSAV